MGKLRLGAMRAVVLVSAATSKKAVRCIVQWNQQCDNSTQWFKCPLTARALRRVRMSWMPRLLCSSADPPERLQQRYRGLD